MDPQGKDLYPNQADTQPGLEVNPYHLPPKPAWAAESTAATDVAYPSYIATGRSERKTILGLSVLVFWGIVVLLVVLLAGGIGGGVGAGLASRKSACSRYEARMRNLQTLLTVPTV